jgi:hypothetical protein
MPLRVAENFVFGGVDSRSNPTNHPTERSIVCTNWVPVQGGWLEVRKGYAPQTMSAVVATPIHSLIDFLYSGTRYILFAQGTALKTLNLSTNAVVTVNKIDSTPFVLSNSNKLSFYRFNNRIFFGNGTDTYFFDGVFARPIGIREPSAAEIAAAVVAEGVRAPSSAEATASTVGVNAAGGTFGITASTGYQVYLVYFDPTTNEYAAATAIGARKTFAAGAVNKIVLTTLPNLSTVNTNWIKLIARTGDGADPAYCCATQVAAAVTTISRAANVVSVNKPAHGYATGDVVIIASSVDTSFNGIFKITVVDANNFTYADSGSNGATTASTVQKLLTVANATLAVDITSTAIDASIPVTADRSIPQSTVGGAQPGYQVWMSYYNPTTGHVGNRVKIGNRLKSTTADCNFHVTGLPDLSGVNTEWVKLIARTGDGAEVPYPFADAGINWTTVANATTSYTFTDRGLDYDSELPSRNGLPPAFDKCVRVGDRIYVNAASSADIAISETAADDRNGIFVGNPWESFASTNTETFPTGDNVTCLQEYQGEAVIFTYNDSALLADLGGPRVWRGPFPVGSPAQRVFCRSPFGPFWVTSDKELATIGPNGPMVVSEEYESGLLAQIGDAYISNVEVAYTRDPLLHYDHIKIKGQDSNGAALTIIHDFKLIDGRSVVGQGRKVTYSSALANDFSVMVGRNASSRLTSYAGGSDGQIYVLDSGDSDNGATFDNDYIALTNYGTDRPSIPYFEWMGDEKVVISVAKALNSTTADFAELKYEAVPGKEGGFHFRAFQDGSGIADHAYVRIQLTSHSADGSLALNNPLHIPVEDYGRVYLLRVCFGEARGH